MRDIQITAVLNGWIVRVGCQTVVFDKVSVLIAWMTSYLMEPVKTEKEFLAQAINLKLFPGANSPAVAVTDRIEGLGRLDMPAAGQTVAHRDMVHEHNIRAEQERVRMSQVGQSTGEHRYNASDGPRHDPRYGAGEPVPVPAYEPITTAYDEIGRGRGTPVRIEGRDDTMSSARAGDSVRGR